MMESLIASLGAIMLISGLLIGTVLTALVMTFLKLLDTKTNK